MNKILKLDLTDNFLSYDSRIIAGATGLSDRGCEHVTSVCADYSGNIFVSDMTQHAIFKVSGDGAVSLYAGLPGTSGNNRALVNIPTHDARFNKPMGICCDRSGRVYVADSGNNQIRVIESGKVNLVAGDGLGASGYGGGQGADATFNFPIDVKVDRSGVVYVCDQNNHAIRVIRNGWVYTLAGDGSAGDNSGLQADGRNYAFFSSPSGIALDTNGNVYVLDNGNKKIKKITPNGWVSRLSGSGYRGTSLGHEGNQQFTCEYNEMRFGDIDRSGNLYFVDVYETFEYSSSSLSGDSKSSASSTESMSEYSKSSMSSGGPSDSSAGHETGTRVMKVDCNGIPSVVINFDGTLTPESVIAVAVDSSQSLFIAITTEGVGYSSSSSFSSSSMSISSSSSSSSSTMSTSSSSTMSSQSVSSSSSSSSSSSTLSSSSRSSSSYIQGWSSSSSSGGISSSSSSSSSSSLEYSSSSSSSSSSSVEYSSSSSVEFSSSSSSSSSSSVEYSSSSSLEYSSSSSSSSSSSLEYSSSESSSSSSSSSVEYSSSSSSSSSSSVEYSSSLSSSSSSSSNSTSSSESSSVNSSPSTSSSPSWSSQTSQS